MTAKKVKGKKAKREPLHDETLHKTPAAEQAHPGNAQPERAATPVPGANPDAEHVGRLPLGPDDLDRLHALLVARRVRALRTSNDLRRDESELTEAEAQSAELMERGTDRTMEAAIEAEAETERSLLGEVDTALARMDVGSYGVCERCEERIALSRLLAIPETRLCIRCAREASGPPR